MIDRIGMDAGGSLIKLAYEERGHLHTKTYNPHELKELVNWIQLVSPNAQLFLTGGKSALVQSHFTQKCFVVDEFPAAIAGTKLLLEMEKKKVKDEFILVSIGTGTSIFYVTKEKEVRLLGTGIGGGTLLGLGSLITGRNDFHHLAELALKGKHEQSDLLVADIYAPNEPPVPGHLTAANFGKAHENMKARVEDHVAALNQLIGEVVISLAQQAAANKQVEHIVFIGSTLSGNKALKDVLASFTSLMPYQPVFLDKGAYAGAAGALYV
ncbi:type II pantothenate kinase [Oceanobacillus piezotolerans]|uniref:Type II pantothenate kinase n=1 Tax=Oceanobacillus piezotolerans TaxID=2448030 RepID=A0A498DG42_9BACI|nr:type II pantothenate kinase [Oceanobacillus piezotolerans]RLL46911.1 type II pantothenate kinase [Oceanobacillus piezotolerans]